MFREITLGEDPATMPTKDMRIADIVGLHKTWSASTFMVTIEGELPGSFFSKKL
jgi:hypothetical protein